MKNAIKWFGFIALIAVIGFSFAACGDGGGGGGGDTAVTFSSATADGDASQTTTQLTLTFSQAITGLSASDITLSGVANVNKGTLSGSGPTYILPISGFTTDGTLNVAVAKPGYAISGSPKTVPIYYYSGGGGGTAPAIATATLPGGTVDAPYTPTTLEATGDEPITWDLDSGTLPTGLNLAGATGVISGTPTAAGTSNFTVKAVNVAGSDTKQLTITIFEPIEMLQIQGGTFTMGSPENETGRYPNETQHQVTLTGFYMSKYLVTQAQYEAVMGNNPSYFRTPVAPERSTANRPVELVTWYDAVEFCNRLSTQEGLTPVYTITGRTPVTGYPIKAATVTADWNTNGYRLPTEAQWEYACRAGTSTAYNTGNTISDGTGWYYPYSDNRTHSVGQKPANAWGLYDMHGNVMEWCWDWFDDGYYSISPAQDPTGAVSGEKRVNRGGVFASPASGLRSALRNYTYPYYDDFPMVGIRLVRP
jgi:formylglycine-generating enzyme required for sulfatase activity